MLFLPISVIGIGEFMKSILTITIITFMLASCDTPTRNRYIDTGGTGINTSGTINPDTTVSGYTQGGIDDNITTNTATNTNTTTEQGYESCNLTPQYYGGTMGYFGVCKHSNDDRGFKFKFSTRYGCQGGTNESTNCGNCFIPMHKKSSGGSYALGPAQCVHNDAGKEYYGTFSIYLNQPVNAIMAIHRYAVDSFFQCMGAYQSYLNNCSGGASNPYCIQQASAYADSVCTSFENTHRQNYKQVSF